MAPRQFQELWCDLQMTASREEECSAPRPGSLWPGAKALPYSIASHLGHFSAGGCPVGPVTSLCAMQVTVVSLFLSIIGVAASVGFFRVVMFRTVAGAEAVKCEFCFPCQEPSVRGRSAGRTVLTGITPGPRSSIPGERQDSNTSDTMESKSSRLPVLRGIALLAVWHLAVDVKILLTFWKWRVAYVTPWLESCL